MNIDIFVQIKNEKLNGWKEKSDVKHSEVTSYINQIKLYEWEIKKYIQFASKNGEDLGKTSSHLFGQLKDFIAYCNKTSGAPFNLEDIRTAQFNYNEAARKVHSELMGT
ncbi:MAG: hypothetical protein L3J15_08940 [Devosiaceae bacterium]|nr:hypothetical protein [Devosiaceae bacterium]